MVLKRIDTQITLKRQLPFVLLYIVFFVAAVLLSWRWYAYRLNPDASAYFTIAAKYADLNIVQAINGYWGPLFSLLLVPAVWLGLNLTIAAKVLTAVFGLAILIVVYQFLLRKNVSRVISFFICLWLSFLLLDAVTMQPITPDLLLALLILVFAVRLNDFLEAPSRSLGIQLGIVGSLMYFTKGFGFFLFVGVIGLIAFWQWLRAGHTLKCFTRIVKRYAPTLVAFTVLALPFITVISIKYHQPTINTAGAFDHNLFGPVAKGVAYPMVIMGPLSPPNDSASSVWEDPTDLTPLIAGAGWSPLDSVAYFKYFMVDVIGHNVNRTVEALVGYGAVVAVGVVVMTIGGLRGTKLFRREYILFGFISLLMVSGYCLVLVEDRYIWAVAFLAVMGLGLWLSTLQAAKLLRPAQIVLGGILACALMLLTTTQKIVETHDSHAQQNHATLTRAYKLVPPDSKIISDTFSSFTECYYFDLHCYSVLSPPLEAPEAYYQRLKQLGITYYVDYHSRETDIPLRAFVARYYIKLGDRKVDGKVISFYELR